VPAYFEVVCKVLNHHISKEIMNRRSFLQISSAAIATGTSNWSKLFATTLHRSAGKVVLQPGEENGAAAHLELRLNHSGSYCRPTVVNHGIVPVRVKEIELFTFSHSLPSGTKILGESFQMLSQEVGTLTTPIELGLSDRKHYSIPGPTDATYVTSMLSLLPPDGDSVLLAYTSCKKFIGRFYIRPGSISVVIDTEGLSIAPNEIWQLEEFTTQYGKDLNVLFERLTKRLNANHPRHPLPKVPTGWCSYYCFGTNATAEQVLDNVDVIAKQIPELRYIQIDDGYQPAMGDWFLPGKHFNGNVKPVLKQIKERGLEPAIWVAPFIASEKSEVLAQHPEWFMSGEDGKPLAAAKVTFTGWGSGGWYALDGTHPEVQQHFEQIFRTMREDWGCTYFKLDANFWGAMHGGRLHDPKATRIEAYRRGMEAVRRGAGDAFILGCNHPIWPSLGLIDSSRNSNDISRKWSAFSERMEESLHRNWQNGRLWWNDPDAVLLTGSLSNEEYLFHATAAYASGGMILSGDNLLTISPERLAMLKKLLPPSGVAAVFDDPTTLEVGRTHLDDRLMISVFNRSDKPKTISFRITGRSRITDFWSDEDLGTHTNSYTVHNLAPHSARLLRCMK
jgi:alpha-galactosidase